MKVSLQDMRKMDIFEEIEQPGIVYHMTTRKNIEAILREGKIRAVSPDGRTSDYVTWFFPALEEIPVYIELTGADTGRKYHDFDGRIHTAPPLIHSETVVLKLIPRGNQAMEWYKEHPLKNGRNLSTMTSEEVSILQKYMTEARICHYGAMRFERNPEIIELTEVDKLPASDKLNEIRRIKESHTGGG